MTPFNKPAENDRYRIYQGPNNAQMPNLLQDGCVPMNFAQVMQRRLEILNESRSSRAHEAWWNSFLDTGDGAQRHSKGSMRIVYDSSTLRSLTTKSILRNGALLLTPDEYTAGDGRTFTLDEVMRHTGHHHSSVDAVLENPIWQALARDNTTLLREYARAVFGKYHDAMSIRAPDIMYERSVERLWVAGSLVNNDRGGAYGFNFLDDGGRLVGVAPEAHPPTIAHPDEPARR